MRRMVWILVFLMAACLQACGSDSPQGNGTQISPNSDVDSSSTAEDGTVDGSSASWEQNWLSDDVEEAEDASASNAFDAQGEEVDASMEGAADASECVEGESCDDGNPCTGVASCVMGVCTAIAPKCYDGIPCTQDLCNEEDGTCTYPLNDGSCYIDNTCVELGSSNPEDDCLQCFPALSTVDWVTPVEECNGIDDDCDGQLDEGCDLFPAFSWFPANPSPGQALLIRVEDLSYRQGGRLVLSGDCGSVPVIFYGVKQEGENWVWEFGVENIPPGAQVLEFLEGDELVGLANLKAAEAGVCPPSFTPDIAVVPFAPVIGDSLVVELVSSQSWGAPQLEVRDSCGLVDVMSTDVPTIVETGPVQGGIVTYAWRDGPFGTLISHGAIAVAGSPLCPEALLQDSDGDGLHDLEDNCPGTANPSQHDQDNDGIGDSCDSWAKGLVPALEFVLTPTPLEGGEPGVLTLQTPDEYVGVEVSCTGPCGVLDGLMNQASNEEGAGYVWEFPLIPASGGSYLCGFSVLGGGNLPDFSFEVVGPVVCAGCGDGECVPEESCETCAVDCECTSCGDGICGLEEDCYSCPTDCPCPFVCEEMGAACAAVASAQQSCADDIVVGLTCQVYGSCSGIGGPEMCSWGPGTWCDGLCDSP